MKRIVCPKTGVVFVIPIISSALTPDKTDENVEAQDDKKHKIARRFGPAPSFLLVALISAAQSPRRQHLRATICPRTRKPF